MSDDTKKIFGDYVYSTESDQDHAIIGAKNNIPPNVTTYEFDDSFLIAKQKPFVDVLVIKRANKLFDLYENDQIDHKDSLYLKFKQYGAQNNRHENFKIAEMIAKEILSREDTVYKKYIENDYLYWVLQRSSDSLMGPLTEVEFEATRKSMSVSDKLKLE